MARYNIECKEKTMEEIRSMAKKKNVTVKQLILSALGLKEN